MNYLISSDQIREQIKQAFDSDKSWFDEKLYKTKAIKDTFFYYPAYDDLFNDIILVKAKIAKEFQISPQEVKNLATDAGIYDCDNMARKLRVTLNDIHYERYRHGKHTINNEYPVWQITEERPVKDYILRHDYCIIFTKQGIRFADLMYDKYWSISEFKPVIVGIS